MININRKYLNIFLQLEKKTRNKDEVDKIIKNPISAIIHLKYFSTKNIVFYVLYIFIFMLQVIIKVTEVDF